MNIVLIDVMPAVETRLRELGHRLKTYRPGGGVFHLPWMLARDGFEPDFVLQQEALGSRSYLGGLERLPCPSAFWAVDSHLNLFWQQWYARLFDLTLTPHVSLFAALPELFRPRHMRRFAWPGEARAFVPHAGRSQALGLCARVTKHRPIRAWMTELLLPRGLMLKDDLSYARMLSFYDDTRVIPNECIANEVNFRLMEGASSGCLVLGPDVGEDQNALFEPGKEHLIYRDGLELLDLVHWATARPAAAERIGRAASRRVQAQHLPKHRVAELLRAFPATSGGRLEGRAAVMVFWLVLALQIRNGPLELDAEAHAEEGRKLIQVLDGIQEATLEGLLAAQVMAQVFLLLAERPAQRDKALRLYKDIFTALRCCLERGERGKKEDPLLHRDVLAAASAFALKEGQLDAAIMFYSLCDARKGLPRPGGAAELCAAWSGLCAREGKIFTAGFTFDPDKGSLPEGAFAWLLFGLYLEPNARAAFAPRFDALLENRPPLLSLYTGYLADHCLIEPSNWRVQLAFGLACIRACRVGEGLHEIREARKKARAQGRERLFQNRFEACWPEGRTWEALL